MHDMDRRDFIKRAGVASAVGVATATGLVGCGASDAADAVSGTDTANLTSTAIARSWEAIPAPIADSAITQTYDAEIVIIGAGLAGVCAAQSAAEEGAKVLVIEKTAQVNGRGLDIGSIGNQFQKDHPEYSQYIDATLAEKIFYEFCHSDVNRLLFRHWAKNSGAAFDHLAAFMKERHQIEPTMSATAPKDRYAADPYYREMPTCQKLVEREGWFDDDGNWLFGATVTKLGEWAKELGAEFYFNTKAEQLVADATGAITGVVCMAEDGSYVKFNASKAVIVATGDIGGNKEMLAAWCPMALRAGANVYTPVGGNEGDGIKMALWAGAGMQHGASAPMVHPLGPGGPLAQSGDSLTFMCVNRDGKRFTVELNNTPGMANALMNQPGGIGYTIFDSNYHEKALLMRPDNVGVDGSPLVGEGTQAKIDAAVAANDGLCLKSDTIEGIAQQIGCDEQTLVAEVARWNELVKMGEDPDMSLPGHLLTSLDTPPYYASFIPQGILVVIYGLNCDSHSRVCDPDDNPIPNLYALGNAQGNFFAKDYPLVCPGLSHGRCVTFGYTLPKAILNGELI